jgi:hypothetical protein
LLSLESPHPLEQWNTGMELKFHGARRLTIHAVAAKVLDRIAKARQAKPIQVALA